MEDEDCVTLPVLPSADDDDDEEDEDEAAAAAAALACHCRVGRNAFVQHDVVSNKKTR